MHPVDLLIEQLWAPAVAEGARVVVDPAPDPDWADAERYWALPDASRARLLLPVGPREVTAAAATNYRGLRRPPANAGRALVGRLARLGLPLSRHQIAVQVRRTGPRPLLPLEVLRKALGADRVYAATGVRSGANRKATLHLLDGEGHPLGYAKVGWSPVTDALVRTEAAALRDVGGRAGELRAPALLAEVDHHGHPVIVTEPLPAGVRGARRKDIAPPSPQELYSLCPVVRWGRLSETAHLRALAGRLGALGADPVCAAVTSRAGALVSDLMKVEAAFPVTSRWHGDLTPWNRARDESGQLWTWDWESSEVDAVAGLDALHWAFSVRRPTSGVNAVVELEGCLADADAHIRAAGVPRSRRGQVAAVYAACVVERAADLAHRSGGWRRLWIDQPDLHSLLDQAGTLVLSAGHTPS